MNYNNRGNEYTQYRNTRTQNAYVYGSAAPKYDIEKRLEEPRRVASPEVRKNREKAKYMSLGYITFIIAALVLAGIVLIGYIRLHADINALSGEITRQEKLINNLKIENDEAWSRVERITDLEDIKRVAIQELGMTYPEEGQIITYEASGYDYVRRVSDSN